MKQGGQRRERKGEATFSRNWYPHHRVPGRGTPLPVRKTGGCPEALEIEPSTSRTGGCRSKPSTTAAVSCAPTLNYRKTGIKASFVYCCNAHNQHRHLYYAPMPTNVFTHAHTCECVCVCMCVCVCVCVCVRVLHTRVRPMSDTSKFMIISTVIATLTQKIE